MFIGRFRNKRIITILTSLLIVLFVVQVVNRGVFYHSHLLGNGIIITHAHPYNKTADSSPYKNHNHTKYEILFLDSQELLFLSLVLMVALFHAKQSENYPARFVSKHIPALIGLQPGRAPPQV